MVFRGAHLVRVYKRGNVEGLGFRGLGLRLEGLRVLVLGDITKMAIMEYNFPYSFLIDLQNPQNSFSRGSLDNPKP